MKKVTKVLLSMTLAFILAVSVLASTGNMTNADGNTDDSFNSDEVFHETEIFDEAPVTGELEGLSNSDIEEPSESENVAYDEMLLPEELPAVDEPDSLENSIPDEVEENEDIQPLLTLFNLPQDYGTESNPFEISSVEQLEALADYVNNPETMQEVFGLSKVYIKLVNDIDLSEHSNGNGWIPIGRDINAPFNGVFDGNGHAIKGLYTNNTNLYTGLFGYVADGGTIKNLGLIDVEIIGDYHVGGIAGYIASGEIINCYTSGKIRGNNYVGGLTGCVVVDSDAHASVINSYSACDVSGTYSYIGGIAGGLVTSNSHANAKIENCYSTGTIVGNGSVGGILGYGNYINGFASLKNCIALNPTLSSNGDVGMIIGRATQSKYDFSDIFSFDGMIVEGNNTGENGIRESADKINSSGFFENAFQNDENWTFSTGRLPLLCVSGMYNLINGQSNGEMGDYLNPVPATSIALDKSDIALTVGEVKTLMAYMQPTNATDKLISWSSSNPNIATVSNSGVVAAVSFGSATITATAINGVSSECYVTVKKASGGDVSGKPTVKGTPTHNSININPVANVGGTGQLVEYSISQTSEETSLNDWQTSLVFTDLTPDTIYYVYARTQENEGYYAGLTQQSEAITTAVIEEIPNEADSTDIAPNSDNGGSSNNQPDDNDEDTLSSGDNSINTDKNIPVGSYYGGRNSTPVYSQTAPENVNAADAFNLVLTEADIVTPSESDSEYALTIAGQDNIVLSVPVSALGDYDLVVHTDYGSIRIPSEVLQALRDLVGDTVSISIRRGSFVFSILDANGEETAYKTPNNPIALTLPYTLESGQLLENVVAVKKDNEKNIIIPQANYAEDFITFPAFSTGTYDLVYNKKVFTDTEVHSAETDISFVTARELFSGVGNGRFAPDSTMTRAMFITVLARIDAADILEYSTPRFKDVSTGEWYSQAVGWAADNGIVMGVGNGEFKPDAPITYEQMSSILENYVNHKGYSFDLVSGAIGIQTGAGSQDIFTRAEAASIFARFVEMLC